jgi:hypothetical protein
MCQLDWGGKTRRASQWQLQAHCVFPQMVLVVAAEIQSQTCRTRIYEEIYQNEEQKTVLE